ncbi:MAG: hypothetical protein GY838_17465, partial [bacterium]|nr:hypothetical protein [bacterium]
QLGRIYPEVANPWWFDKVLVLVELDGERIFLDPSDRRLAFGRLAPGNEGTPALVVDRKKPEVITLPTTPFDQNHRRATLDLALAEDGRVTGSGSLELRGHHAWKHLDRKEGEEETAESWQEWLEGAFEGYEIGELSVAASVEEQQVRVAWALAQREEEVLGDEASLEPSQPLGPAAQPFTLPASRRLTPVQFAFADRDEVELSLSWPAPWVVDVLPEAVDYQGSAGAVLVRIAVDEASHRLTYRRRFDVTGNEFIGPEDYAAIRDLYGEVEKNDAQNLVLVRR